MADDPEHVIKRRAADIVNYIGAMEELQRGALAVNPMQMGVTDAIRQQEPDPAVQRAQGAMNALGEWEKRATVKRVLEKIAAHGLGEPVDASDPMSPVPLNVRSIDIVKLLQLASGTQLASVQGFVAENRQAMIGAAVQKHRMVTQHAPQERQDNARNLLVTGLKAAGVSDAELGGAGITGPEIAQAAKYLEAHPDVEKVFFRG
jgi:hypothetical protein